MSILFSPMLRGLWLISSTLFKQKKIRDHKLYYCTITITQVSDEKIGKSGDRSRNNTENKKTIIWEGQTGLKDHHVYGFRVWLF